MIENKKVVVFGAGFRAKKFIRFVGNEWISAILVTNPNIEKKSTVSGIRIIGFDDYKESFFGDPIIITPADEDSIIRELEENDIHSYYRLKDMPSEFQGYGKLDLHTAYDSLVQSCKRHVVIFGINAFSFFLQQLLVLDGHVVDVLDAEMCEKYEADDGISVLYASRVVSTASCGIDALDYATNNESYYNTRMAALNNVYKNKRCFIVATGPSLQKADLEKLAYMHEFCFGMNRIYQMEECPVTFDAYVVTDNSLLEEDSKAISDFYAKYKFLGNTNSKSENVYQINVVANDAAGEKPRFSDNAPQKVYAGGTVTYACIQIAVWLGFREIVLLGVDCNYNLPSGTHFYDNSQDDKKYRDVTDMFDAFESAKKYADSHGIKIYNATRGGMLEVFERVDFDSLFKE